MVIRIFPKGQINETLNDVVEMSLSASFIFSLTKNK